MRMFNHSLSILSNLLKTFTEMRYFIGDSTTELSTIIEETSASMEEMNATVENLNHENHEIAAEMRETEEIAKSM